MTLQRGSRFGAYEVLGLLGVGGMGEVYRARDTKLNRDVALKMLPEAFALDADRCARFEREAQILASLSHPAIGAIYGLEDAERAGGAAGRALRALVLELIDGPTLADEIATGPLPVKRALEIARQIADALEAAHESGIVHRDLKPANVKVRSDGVVKVLDFGLAKALDSRVDASPARTLKSPALTEVGVLFGTAAYMSPEQARGRAADKRSDVWAFGCVLYEMLTGKRAFPGDEVSDVVAAILRAEPDWSSLSADVPPQVRKLLRRCLEKDRARRLRDVGDARLEIDDALGAPEAAANGTSAVPRVLERVAWAAGAVALAAGAALATARWTGSGAGSRAPETRLDVSTPSSPSPMSFAMSPDGRSVVFNADGPRGPQLWVRSLDNLVPRALAGTEGGTYPFWSPDGRSVGFFTVDSLKRVDVDGGRPQTLAPVLTPAGGTWGADGTILYVPRDNGGVFRVPASGGESAMVTPSSARPLAARAPQWLPDGRHYAFFVSSEGESTGVYVGDLEGGTIRRVLAADAPAVYGSGRLWFVNEGTLFAQELDASTWELRGSAARVADDVGANGDAVAVSASAAGAIAYRGGTRHLRRQLAWLDRAGRRLGTIGALNNLRTSSPSLSPDGRRLLITMTERQNVDIWSVEIDREGLLNRLTTNPLVDSFPLWAPDGARFVAISTVGTERGLVIKRVDGSAPDELVSAFGTESGAINAVRIPTDWTPDGRALLLKVADPITGTFDLALLSLDGQREPQPIASTPYNERDGQFSPDGRWLAFESNESGTPEIYVQPFPGPGPKQRVSTASGTQARWRRDGRELFYVALDGALMAVPVDLAPDRPSFGPPTPLFKTRLAPSVAISRQQYVVANDGERFLMVSLDDAPTPPITLLLNWQPPAVAR